MNNLNIIWIKNLFILITKLLHINFETQIKFNAYLVQILYSLLNSAI